MGNSGRILSHSKRPQTQGVLRMGSFRLILVNLTQRSNSADPAASVGPGSEVYGAVTRALLAGSGGAFETGALLAGSGGAFETGGDQSPLTDDPVASTSQAASEPEPHHARDHSSSQLRVEERAPCCNPDLHALFKRCRRRRADAVSTAPPQSRSTRWKVDAFRIL